jgi:hypothetical protein
METFAIQLPHKHGSSVVKKNNILHLEIHHKINTKLEHRRIANTSCVKSPSSVHHKQIGDTEGQGLTAERFVFWPKLQMEPETPMPEFTIQSPRGNAKQIHHI